MASRAGDDAVHAGSSLSGMQHDASAPLDTVFTNYKAGMEGVDKEKVKAVVHEVSKGSVHFKNEQRKMAATQSRISRMQQQAHALTPDQLAGLERAVDDQMCELEATRDLSRTWLHVDMDAFFAAVEERDRPDLKEKPTAVGGMGMISTANYVARRFGVRSAMPGFIALKLCPQLIFVKPNFAKYTEASASTREVFRIFDPDFEAGSLDEAYLDVTEYCQLHGMSGGEVAATLRRRVEENTKLTCSVGIAPNRMLAKVCSDRNKPNGQFELLSTVEAVRAFVSVLELRKVPGIGKVTEQVLRAFDIQYGADMHTHRALLAALLSPLSLDFFMRIALGLGSTTHSPPAPEGGVGRKGMGCERTFRNMSSREEMEAKCAELAEHLAADMASEELKGRTLTLKLKAANFEVRTRAVTLGKYIHTASDILEAALKLLRAELPIEIRLMGLRMSGFHEQVRPPGQLSLDDVFAARGGKSCDGPPARRSEDGDDEVHTSQGLGEGEMLELSLQDWGTKTEPGSGRSSPVPTPAGEAQADRAAPSGEAHGPRPELPSGSGTGEWACSACTLLNSGMAGGGDACGTRRRQPSAPQRGAQRKRPAPVTGGTLDRFLARGRGSVSDEGRLQSGAREEQGSGDIAECGTCREWVPEAELEQHMALHR